MPVMSCVPMMAILNCKIPVRSLAGKSRPLPCILKAIYCAVGVARQGNQPKRKIGMGRGGSACGVPILCRQNVRDTVRRPASKSNFYQRANNVANLMMQVAARVGLDQNPFAAGMNHQGISVLIGDFAWHSVARKLVKSCWPNKCWAASCMAIGSNGPDVPPLITTQGQVGSTVPNLISVVAADAIKAGVKISGTCSTLKQATGFGRIKLLSASRMRLASKRGLVTSNGRAWLQHARRCRCGLMLDQRAGPVACAKASSTTAWTLGRVFVAAIP